MPSGRSRRARTCSSRSRPGSAPSQIDAPRARRASAGRIVKVGFNHRFHPALARARRGGPLGTHGELMHLRGRYGHGGRPGYDREWRAQPERSGGGELIDQGMHLLDLTHWLAGPLPLHSALLRTQFWDTPVEDNAALILGAADDRRRHGRCCTSAGPSGRTRSRSRSTAGPPSSGRRPGSLLRAADAADLPDEPELGPPELEERASPDEDLSWRPSGRISPRRSPPARRSSAVSGRPLRVGAGRGRVRSTRRAVRGGRERASTLVMTDGRALPPDLHPRRRPRHAARRGRARTPKPLLEVAGEPFLLHQLRLLAG